MDFLNELKRKKINKEEEKKKTETRIQNQPTKSSFHQWFKT